MPTADNQPEKSNWLDNGLVGLVLVFCLVMVGLQLLPQDTTRATNAVTNSQTGIRFESIVRGCNNVTEKTSRGLSLSADDQPASLEIGHAALTYRRTVSHACCLTVELAYEQKQQAIIIKEKWQGTPCRCVCTTQTQALFIDVPAGEYTVTAIEQTPAEGEKTLLTQTVAIPE